MNDNTYEYNIDDYVEYDSIVHNLLYGTYWLASSYVGAVRTVLNLVLGGCMERCSLSLAYYGMIITDFKEQITGDVRLMVYVQ